MRKLIKSLSFGLVLITMLVFISSPALASKTDINTESPTEVTSVYNPDQQGNFVCKVNVPEDFDEIVCLVLMDNYGGPQNFLLLPENDYVLHDEVICGPYKVSGYVNNDTMLEYKVTRSVDSVKIDKKVDTEIELTVTGTKKTELKTPVNAPDTEIAEEGSVNNIASSETYTEAEVDSEPTPESSDNSTEEPEDTTEKDVTEENPGKSALEKIMISILGNVVFVGIIAGIVYVVRKKLIDSDK